VISPLGDWVESHPARLSMQLPPFTEYSIDILRINSPRLLQVYEISLYQLNSLDNSKKIKNEIFNIEKGKKR